MIRYILWDFDGVILDSVDVKTHAFYDMYLPYGKEIADKVVKHHVENGGVSRFEKFKLYHKEFLQKDLTNEDVKKMADQFSNVVLEKVIASPFVPGSQEFITKFYDKYEFYIISGTPDNEIKDIVKRKDLARYFKGVMGSPQKKPEWTQELIRQQLIHPEETLFIGDAMSDYEAAKAHNLKFILRQTEDNQALFDKLEVLKVKDLTQLEYLVEGL